ncbi:MAG: hypothetical protein ACOYU2_06065 [Nitrospirota bacterium]
MRKTLPLLIAITLFLMPSYAIALDTSADTGKTKKTDKEQSQSLKKSKEEKESKGKKKADTTSIGIDRQTQEALKEIGQAMSQTGADVTLPLEAVFLDRIAQLEKDTEPFRTCKVATAPKLGRDFGLTGETHPGVINVVRSENLEAAAKANSYITSIPFADEQAIKAYRYCLASYGAVIAQAYLYLTADLNDLKVSVSKDESGNISVKGIGYDDFIILADSALQKALQGVTNSTIKRIYDRALNDNSPCQFDRSIENIKCGSSLVILGAKPQLYISGIQWYGERFAGYQGSYKVSKSWSYQDAIEKLKSTSKYSKWASEVSKYAEELESQGRAKEATLVRKKAFELAKSGKQAISPNHLLSGLH